jgi:hypothetical protein
VTPRTHHAHVARQRHRRVEDVLEAAAVEQHGEPRLELGRDRLVQIPEDVRALPIRHVKRVNLRRAELLKQRLCVPLALPQPL